MAKWQRVEGLGPRLRPIYEAIETLLAGSTREDVRSRHRVGVLIGEIKGAEDKYGAHAVERLAVALGSNVHTLYRSASVAERWSRDEFEVLLARAADAGRSLSWSHLVALAGVASRQRRGDLLQKTLDEGLTVRQLLKHIALRTSVREPNGSSNVALLRLARTMERWLHLAGRMHDEVLLALGRSGTALEDPTHLLQRAIIAQERLQAIVQAHMARLRAESLRLGYERSPAKAVGALLEANRPRG
jgi:GGDEF domain-containing protein